MILPIVVVSAGNNDTSLNGVDNSETRRRIAATSKSQGTAPFMNCEPSEPHPPNIPDSGVSAASSVSRPNRRKVLAAGAAAVASVAGARTASGDFALVQSLPQIVKRTISYDSVTKKRAIADYHENMRPFGGSLSRHGRHLLHQPKRFGAPGILTSSSSDRAMEPPFAPLACQWR